MAVVVCCPCGNPLDCDNLDLVVSLACPRCKSEIVLELETAPGRASRALLTIMEGPHWIGERFVVPVGVELAIGTGSGNWLSLEGDGLSEVHCRLRLSDVGLFTVEDCDSGSGTWIAEQRIVRGQLAALGSFRVGEFRLRLDFQTADGTEAAPAASVEEDAGAVSLPILARVMPMATPGRWLVSNRFVAARFFMIGAGWLLGISHGCGLQLRPEGGWLPHRAYLAGVVVLVALLVAGRRVTLLHRHLKFGSIAVLGLVAIVDLVWGLPVSAVAALLLAACLTLLIIRTPSPGSAIFGALVGLAAVTMMGVLAVQGLLGVSALGR